MSFALTDETSQQPQSAFRPTAGQAPPPVSHSVPATATPVPAAATAARPAAAAPFAGMYDSKASPAAATTDPLAPYKNERITGPYSVSPNDPNAKTPQYDADGIPLTQDAWNMQGSIDNGKLHAVYDSLKNTGKYKDSGSLDQAVVGEYLADARKEGKNAAFMEEMMPTQVDASLGAIAKTTVGLDGPDKHPLAVDKTTAEIRLGNAQVAQAYEKANPGKDMYSLVVPYSNSVQNIIANDGIPKDGVAKMGDYLNQLNSKDVTKIATGYSQGGAAVLGYEQAHPTNDQGLDYAVALAPMGGADQHGGTGVWSGARNGVNTISVSHQMDPAAGIYDSGGPLGKAHLWEGMTNFVASPNGWLHGTPNKDDARLGTYGYPTQQLMPKVDNFFASAKQGPAKAYSRDGDWNITPTGPEGQHVDPSKPGNPSVGSVLGEAGSMIGNGLKSAAGSAWSGVKSLGSKAADAGKGLLNGIRHLF